MLAKKYYSTKKHSKGQRQTFTNWSTLYSNFIEWWNNRFVWLPFHYWYRDVLIFVYFPFKNNEFLINKISNK